MVKIQSCTLPDLPNKFCPEWVQVDDHISSSPAVIHDAPLVHPPAEEGYTQPMQRWDIYADHSSGAAGGRESSLRVTDC